MSLRYSSIFASSSLSITRPPKLNLPYDCFSQIIYEQKMKKVALKATNEIQNKVFRNHQSSEVVSKDRMDVCKKKSHTGLNLMALSLGDYRLFNTPLIAPDNGNAHFLSAMIFSQRFAVKPSSLKAFMISVSFVFAGA